MLSFFKFLVEIKLFIIKVKEFYSILQCPKLIELIGFRPNMIAETKSFTALLSKH